MKDIRNTEIEDVHHQEEERIVENPDQKHIKQFSMELNHSNDVAIETIRLDADNSFSPTTEQKERCVVLLLDYHVKILTSMP